MKIRLLTFFYILTSSILMAQTPKGTLSLEDPDFNNYFLSKDRLPTIKGRVLHLSSNDIGRMKITYWIITPFNQSSVLKVTDINVDGTFELELDYGFPYQEIFIMMDKYFYGGGYINSDLFIELDMDILKKKPVNINGKGVRYFGTDGELTNFMSNHVLFYKEQQADFKRKSMELTNKKELSFEVFKSQFDSLYFELNKLDQKYVNKNPSKYG